MEPEVLGESLSLLVPVGGLRAGELEGGELGAVEPAVVGLEAVEMKAVGL